MSTQVLGGVFRGMLQISFRAGWFAVFRPELHFMWPTTLPPAILASFFICTTITATEAVFSIFTPSPLQVVSGSQVTLEVRSTFSTVLAGPEFIISTAGSGTAVVVDRQVDTGLSFIGTDPADPFAAGLPANLSAPDPLHDVLLGLQMAHRPGDPLDGMPAGTDVRLETLIVRLAGRGEITLTISDPDAVETQSDPSGRLFDSVFMQAEADSVTFNLALDADFDGDADVDQSDFGDLQVCFSEAGGPVPPGCEPWDLDGDDDVDGDDYTLFESCASGAGIPSSLDCRGLFELMSPSPPVLAAGAADELPPLAVPFGAELEILGDGDDAAQADDAELMQACSASELTSAATGGCDDPPPATGGTVQRRPHQAGQAGPWPRGAGHHGQPSDSSGLARLTVPPPKPRNWLTENGTSASAWEAPAFELATLVGGRVSNPDPEHAILVLNFVAPDCPWCKRQIPRMARLDDVYSPSGVRFVNVVGQLGTREYRDDEVQAIFDALGSRIEIARDPGGAVEQAFAALLPGGQMLYPATFVLGRSGRIEEVVLGAGQEARVQARIETLLGLTTQNSGGTAAAVKRTFPRPQSVVGALGDTYEPGTLNPTRTFNLPQGHTWFVPVIASLDKDPQLPPENPLPWHNDLYNLYGLTTYVGRYIRAYIPHFADAFGLTINDGPAYPPTIPPATVRLIEYTSTGCNPAKRNLATPAPPSFTEAKAAADGFCQTLCGQGFEMTDFDMNQWKYICYNYNTGSGYKSYNIITWGGTQCKKTDDNGLIQACNPLTGVIEIRNNLEQTATTCPACDKDNDGLITLRDLTIERNTAFGPRMQALGLTFPIIYPTSKTVNQTMDLTSYVYPGAGLVDVDYIEITGWDAGIPVNCLNLSEQYNYLDDLTKSNPGDSTLLNQSLANSWCQRSGFSTCLAGALGVTFGHCRINKDGTHSIRAAAGYCMKCG